MFPTFKADDPDLSTKIAEARRLGSGYAVDYRNIPLAEREVDMPKPDNMLFRGRDSMLDGTTLYDRPTYYDCGICGEWHPADWDGDCRDDANRFMPDQLDELHGEHGWDEVPMPGGEDDGD